MVDLLHVLLGLMIFLIILYTLWNRGCSLFRSRGASPEYEVFRLNRQLLDVIMSPKVLATTLYAEGLIDFHTKERVQQVLYPEGQAVSDQHARQILLDAVEQQCRVNAEVFYRFTDILRGEPTTQYAADRLQKCLDRCRTKCHKPLRGQGNSQRCRRIYCWIAGVFIFGVVLLTAQRIAIPPFELSVMLLLSVWTFCLLRWQNSSTSSDSVIDNHHGESDSDSDVEVDGVRTSSHKPVTSSHADGDIEVDGAHTKSLNPVLAKEPAWLRYSGPCASKTFHRTQRSFIRWILLNDTTTVNEKSQRIVREESIPIDIKVIATCYQALSKLIVEGNVKLAGELFLDALKRAQHPDCVNGELLQGRILGHYASFLRANNRYEEARTYITDAKSKMWLASPSLHKAGILFEDIQLKLNYVESNEVTGSAALADIEKDFVLLLQQREYFEEYEEPALCVFLIRTASFYLRSSSITDQLPPLQCRPTEDDIRRAESCLEKVPLKCLPNEINFYVAVYYLALSDLHLWKQQYDEAIQFAVKAEETYLKGNISKCSLPGQRIQLLKKLQLQHSRGDEILNAILDD